MTAPIIKTPRGLIKIGKNGEASLVWDPNFQSKWQGQFTDAQKFVDSDILRLSEPYIPLRTGTLIKTGILGTDIGSGLVRWIAPYASGQYYSPRSPGSHSGALRGPFWFERGKQVWGKQVIAGGKKIAGGG